MAAARSLHIGLDGVDTEAYAGWPGTLAACENDARAMHLLAEGVGYRARTLLTRDATSGAVLAMVAEAAASSVAGDVFLLTYAGHGGQLPDLDSEEEDRLDETWLLWNRELLDDELRLALTDFAPGVRVVVLSDSCHSGTVVRARPGERPRGAPAWVQAEVLRLDGPLYQHLRRRNLARSGVTTEASVLLLSGCQDDQLSRETGGHGAFTTALLQVWDGGTYAGSYRSLRDDVAALLPDDQEPNLLLEGTPWPGFDLQRPFAVDPPDPAGGPTPTEGEPSGAGLRVTIALEAPATPAVLVGLRTLLETVGGAAVLLEDGQSGGRR